jgi:hypothetical protein
LGGAWLPAGVGTAVGAPPALVVVLVEPMLVVPLGDAVVSGTAMPAAEVPAVAADGG